jgi:predicted MPP superfamily phosphohydrolase
VRWIRPTALGAWLVRRVLDALTFTPVPVTLGRAGPGIDGLRIAWISDLHAGSLLRAPDLVRLFGRLAELQPDLVALGGDLLDAEIDDLGELGEALAKLSPPLGIFAVPGNHERGVDADLSRWTALLEGRGVRVLVNAGVRVERAADSLWVAGVDDLGLGSPALERALEGCREDEPVVLLSHQPDLFVEAAHAGVDLTLSGHTHGGQISFFGFAPWVRGHSRLGWYQGHHVRDHAQLFVGRGAGVTLVPVRIGAAPEIPLIELRATSER